MTTFCIAFYQSNLSTGPAVRGTRAQLRPYLLLNFASTTVDTSCMSASVSDQYLQGNALTFGFPRYGSENHEISNNNKIYTASDPCLFSNVFTLNRVMQRLIIKKGKKKCKTFSFRATPGAGSAIRYSMCRILIRLKTNAATCVNTKIYFFDLFSSKSNVSNFVKHKETIYLQP
jgi:hypothetical protein